MRGLPFSLVWTHRQAVTHGRTVDLSLDSMAAGWWTAVVILGKRIGVTEVTKEESL